MRMVVGRARRMPVIQLTYVAEAMDDGRKGEQQPKNTAQLRDPSLQPITAVRRAVSQQEIHWL